jgi:hypothetical protein
VFGGSIRCIGSRKPSILVGGGESSRCEYIAVDLGEYIGECEYEHDECGCIEADDLGSEFGVEPSGL